MPQAVWVGELSFGLVNIPVKLYTATSPKRVRFHQYEAGTGRRIRYRRVAEGPVATEPTSEEETMWEEATPRPRPVPAADSGEAVDYSITDEDPNSASPEAEVAWGDIVKGYELEPGRVVTVEADELESVAPTRSRTLEVEQFVDLNSIDPVQFEKSYHVVPQRGAVERAYWLLYRALEDAERVAVGRFVLRTKEYLAVLRPAQRILMLHTLFYADEVRDANEIWTPAIAEPSERELQVASQFLDALAGDWEPARHRDEHRERLLELLYGKADQAVTAPEIEEEAPTATAIDLMEALKASVAAAKEARAAARRETG
jgi:DNA end-binding protein Ku